MAYRSTDKHFWADPVKIAEAMPEGAWWALHGVSQNWASVERSVLQADLASGIAWGVIQQSRDGIRVTDLGRDILKRAADAERTKVSSQASGHDRVEPKQKINPSNGDEQP